MPLQYHYNMSCKRISDAGWVTIMRAEQGKIPMSIVQPRPEIDNHSQAGEAAEILTTEPLAQEISDASEVTNYLRGLNRRPGWELSWHNDQVIWNLSLRLGKMEIGQEVKVRISYFATEGIGSGGYEIKLIDAFPDDTSAKTATQESIPSPQSSAVSPIPETADNTGNPVFSSPESEKRREDAGDSTSQLAARVENLQDQLMMVRKTLHQALERIERLETKDRQPAEKAPRPDTIRQRPPQSAPESTAKQPVALSAETQPQVVDTDDDIDEPDLFEFLAQSQQKKSATAKNQSTDNDNVENVRKKQ